MKAICFVHLKTLNYSASFDSSSSAGASASAVAKLQEMAQNGVVNCFLYEAGEEPSSYTSFEADLGLKLIEIDQLGANLDLGPTLYGDVIRNVTNAFASCEG